MMQIDLTCPCEVFRTAMPTEEIPAASLVLFNLSDRVIVSAEITLLLQDAGGAEKERVLQEIRDYSGQNAISVDEDGNIAWYFSAQ